MPGLDCRDSDKITIAFDCPATPQNGSAYSETFAKKQMLPMAAAAYGDHPQDCLNNVLTDGHLVAQRTVRCDSQKQDTCSGFTAFSQNYKAIIVSFRGSAGTAQLIQEGLSALGSKKAFISGGNVLSYFYNGFYDIWNAGMKDDLSATIKQFPDYELWVTGHSLGGSMASLCAAAVVKMGLISADKVKLMTFGQPRTGDLNFAIGHDAILKYNYRVVHAHDLVPHIPPKTPNNWFDGSYHHRFEIFYNNKMTLGSTFVTCNRADDDTCSNAQTDISIDDHLHYFNTDVSGYGRSGCQTPIPKDVAYRHKFDKVFKGQQ